MEPTIEEMLEAMGWTITCQSPFEIEHTDGSTATGKSTQLVVDRIIQEYKTMKEEEAAQAELNKKLEVTKNLDLTKINGREIINFLLEALECKNSKYDLRGISIAGFKFEDQKIHDDTYILSFTGFFNNWGTFQEDEGNEIHINKGGVEVYVGEPFEGDGTDEAIEEVLTEWLRTHEFEKDPEKSFYKILEKAFDELGHIKFADKEELQEVIDQLVDAKTYMK